MSWRRNIEAKEDGNKEEFSHWKRRGETTDNKWRKEELDKPKKENTEKWRREDYEKDDRIRDVRSVSI